MYSYFDFLNLKIGLFMIDENTLPCGIPIAEHKICWEKNCYLSGEGCPVHRGAKKGIIPRLPDYVFDSIVVNGKRIEIGGRDGLHANFE